MSPLKLTTEAFRGFNSAPGRFCIAAVATLACITLLTAAARSWQAPPPAAIPPNTAHTVRTSTVTCLGRLEPMGEVIKLNAPTSSQESLIRELRCEEGDRIKKGQILAVLDCEDRLKGAVRQSSAHVDLANARLAITRAGAKQGEVESQRFEIKRLEAELVTRLSSQKAVIDRLTSSQRQAAIDFARYAALYKERAVSTFDYDQKRLELDIATQNLAEAKSVLEQVQSTGMASIESARATLNRISEVRTVDVDAAKAEVTQARAELLQAQAALDQAYIRAPLDGKVLKIYARPGEKVDSEGFADVGQTQSMFAIAEVYQSDIHKVRLGDPVDVKAEAIPEAKLHGTVRQIGELVRRQNVINEDPSANIDERVVEVHVQLDKDSSAKVEHLSNCQILATIHQ